jgi:hypothetical protein
MNDPSHRASLTQDVLNQRIARWPVVNWVHGLLSPLVSAAVPQAPVDDLLDRHLHADGQPVRTMVQSTFAHLQQSNPDAGELYHQRNLWENLLSAAAEMDLRRALASALLRQRDEAVCRLAGRSGTIAPLVRWLLTIGAILWFPLVQPMLRVWLEGGITDWIIELVKILSATALLHSIGFLAIYFIVIWLAVRWNTQRRVSRLLAKWKSVGGDEPQFNLTSQTLLWIDDLLNPIRDAREKLESLLNRAGELRKSIIAPSPAGKKA